MINKKPISIVVLISGSGSNLQAIIDDLCAAEDQANENAPAKINLVLSNNADAYGLVRAKNAGINTVVVSHGHYASREDFDAAMMQEIERHQPDLIVLAGFMRILSDSFVERYFGRLINIHPSLLPKHKGTNTHQRALDAGDKEHGASVHFVIPELDAGAVIMQGRIQVKQGESADAIQQRVHQLEHMIYPQVVRWFVDGKLSIYGDTVLYQQLPLYSPMQMSFDT